MKATKTETISVGDADLKPNRAENTVRIQIEYSDHVESLTRAEAAQLPFFPTVRWYNSLEGNEPSRVMGKAPRWVVDPIVKREVVYDMEDMSWVYLVIRADAGLCWVVPVVPHNALQTDRLQWKDDPAEVPTILFPSSPAPRFLDENEPEK